MTTNPVLFGTLTVLVLLAVGLATYSYLSMKVELKLITRRGLTRAEFDARLAELTAEIDTLRARLVTAESRTPPAPTQDWTPPQSLNLNRRGQILRLHEKGRSVAEIASDLQISQGEVELLVKVHDWSAASVL